MLRSLMLKLAERPTLVRVFSALGRKSGLFERFVAGEDIESALTVVQRLNRHGIVCSLDLLGEGVTEQGEAGQATEAYISLLRSINESGVESNISIKLTQLGLDISAELCLDNLHRILHEAVRVGNFVRIDMEGSDYTADTLRIFEQALSEFGPEVVGIVIQSYLYRSEDDARRLARLACNVRLCKGAYHEPPEIAFPAKADVDSSYRRLLEILLDSDAYSAIATHDPDLIDFTRKTIGDHGCSLDRFEFQMLYGIRREHQLALCREGFRMRVYVPFGTQWAPYFMRRLAERPANVLFIARSLFRA